MEPRSCGISSNREEPTSPCYYLLSFARLGKILDLAMKIPDRKDGLTDVLQEIPTVTNKPATPTGTVRAEDGTLVTLDNKPQESWLLSLIRKSNRG